MKFLGVNSFGKKERLFRVTELITTLLEARDEKLLLFDISVNAFERKSLIVTTNLPGLLTLT